MRARLAGGTGEQVGTGVGFLYSPHVLFDGNAMYVGTDRIARLDLGKPGTASIVQLLAASPTQGAETA